MSENETFYISENQKYVSVNIIGGDQRYIFELTTIMKQMAIENKQGYANGIILQKEDDDLILGITSKKPISHSQEYLDFYLTETAHIANQDANIETGYNEEAYEKDTGKLKSKFYQKFAIQIFLYYTVRSLSMLPNFLDYILNTSKAMFLIVPELSHGKVNMQIYFLSKNKKTLKRILLKYILKFTSYSTIDGYVEAMGIHSGKMFELNYREPTAPAGIEFLDKRV